RHGRHEGRERCTADRTDRARRIRRDVPVARHANVVVGEIREQRMLAVALTLTRMARRAVALSGIVEECEPLFLQIRQLRLPLLPIIKLAGEGMEVRIFRFVCREGMPYIDERCLWIAEYLRTVCGDKRLQTRR